MNKYILSKFGNTALYENMRFARDCFVTFRKFNVKVSMTLMKKMWTCHKLYNWRSDEFFHYRGDTLGEKECEAFVSDIARKRFAENVSPIEARQLLDDKWCTYELYKKYFNREACLVTQASDKSSKSRYNELIGIKKKLIIKPLCGTLGKGIKIVQQEDATELLKSYPDGFIAEEVIQQDERMAQLHPESVNTLRIHTLQNNGNVEVFHPYIRMGRGNSVVDNAGSGGVFTSCNLETGEVLTAVDEYGHSYINHPDTNFPLIGFFVPCWKEAFDFARQLALENQNIHYCGWDLALSKNGWVLIEGNPRAQMVFQISENSGFKYELIERCGRLGLGDVRKWL